MFDYLATLNPVIAIALIAVVILILFLRFVGKKQETEAFTSDSTPSTDKSRHGQKKMVAGKPGKYSTWVWDDDWGGMKYEHLDYQVGQVMPFQPPWPHAGLHHFGYRRNKDCLVQPFCSLLIPQQKNDTPTDAYDAIVCSEVAEFFADDVTLWEKFKALLPYLILGGEIFVLIIVIDRLAS